jgi:hypothetical protein
VGVGVGVVVVEGVVVVPTTLPDDMLALEPDVAELVAVEVCRLLRPQRS